MSRMTEKFYYMDDFKAGDKFTSGPITVSAEDIIAYAKQFDPQDFHIHPEKAADTALGGHAASGWHTASLTMRMILDATPPMKGGMVGRQVENMSWPRPVRPGDTLRLELEILNIRTSSNPTRGVMRTKNTTYNQNNEPVLEMETIILVPRRVIA